MPTRSILLISGDAVLADRIGAWLNRQPEYVLAGHCSSLESAASYRFTLDPTIVLVDLETSETADATDWTGLTRAFPHAPIIALITANTADTARRRATHAGALRFLSRDSGEVEFSVNLEAALQQAVEIVAERTLKPFTPREGEVLLLMADGLTNAEIAQRLAVSEKTVKRHISAVMGKLGVDNRVKVARWAWERGITGRR